MQLLTWNIWAGKNLQEVINHLKHENADIIGLQEVKVQDTVNCAEIIADSLGYTLTYCPSFTSDRHTPIYELGNAILSRLPLLSQTCHILSGLDRYENSAATEPRTAVEVTVEHHGTPLSVIATHLGYSEKWGESELRIDQLKKLLQIVDTKRCILMGDFNSIPTSSVIQTLNTVMVNTDQDLTKPSFTDYHTEERTKYRIDYIFVSKGVEYSNFAIAESDASDHLPLSIEVK